MLKKYCSIKKKIKKECWKIVTYENAILIRLNYLNGFSVNEAKVLFPYLLDFQEVWESS